MLLTALMGVREGWTWGPRMYSPIGLGYQRLVPFLTTLPHHHPSSPPWYSVGAAPQGRGIVECVLGLPLAGTLNHIVMHANPMLAEVHLEGQNEDGTEISGTITVTQFEFHHLPIVPFKHLRISGEIKGLKLAYHGLHVYDSDTCGSGAVFNPDEVSPGGCVDPCSQEDHGGKCANFLLQCPSKIKCHAGDLQNIYTPLFIPLFGAVSHTSVNLIDTVLTLDDDSDYNIVNKTLVVHAKEDNFCQ